MINRQDLRSDSQYGLIQNTEDSNRINSNDVEMQRTLDACCAELRLMNLHAVLTQSVASQVKLRNIASRHHTMDAADRAIEREWSLEPGVGL